MNPGANVISNKYEFAVDRLIGPNIQQVMQTMLLKGATLAKTKIAITIYTRQENKSISTIKNLILSRFRVNVNIVYKPLLVEHLPTQTTGVEDMMYKIEAKGTH
ncbi:hypothetical protein [Mucilaginibacter kameinonensis]|uniref:hypothetical protein n=1 Tax=Mucilaginibacter kameinonensis TaxID=452286 RepID=UPI000EF7DB53|nr:hypothetical protein [Mucilaginibacter kameinonensis]